MQYFRSEAFKRVYWSLDPARRRRVEKALRQLATLYGRQQRPFGLGLKALKPGIWEVRAGLSDRILFRWTGDTLELLIVGDHDAIRQLLKRL